MVLTKEPRNHNTKAYFWRFLNQIWQNQLNKSSRNILVLASNQNYIPCGLRKSNASCTITQIKFIHIIDLSAVEKWTVYTCKTLISRNLCRWWGSTALFTTPETPNIATDTSYQPRGRISLWKWTLQVRSSLWMDRLLFWCCVTVASVVISIFLAQPRVVLLCK